MPAPLNTAAAPTGPSFLRLECHHERGRTLCSGHVAHRRMTLLLSAETVFLRQLGPEDVTPTYVGWLNDSRVNRYLECRWQPQTLDSVRAYVAGFDGKSRFLFGLFDQCQPDHHIGNFSLAIDVPHATGYYGHLIGDVTYWGKTAATEGTRLLFDFAFLEQNLRKLTGGTYRTNIASVFNFRKFGFVQEGVRREQYADGDTIVDGLIYGLLRNEWLSIREKFITPPGATDE